MKAYDITILTANWKVATTCSTEITFILLCCLFWLEALTGSLALPVCFG